MRLFSITSITLHQIVHYILRSRKPGATSVHNFGKTVMTHLETSVRIQRDKEEGVCPKGTHWSNPSLSVELFKGAYYFLIFISNGIEKSTVLRKGNYVNDQQLGHVFA